MSAILLYLAIPEGYILDWIFFDIKLNTLEILGASIIVGVNVLIASLRIAGIIDKEPETDELKI
jgi:drug/metabolite transporter (DMT)-like permease